MEETIEEVIDAVDVVSGRSAIYIAVGLAVGAAAGASITWLVAKRHYKAKYAELATQEIAEARALYNKLSKGELKFPVVEHEDKELSESGAKAAEALVNYRGDGAAFGEHVKVTETVEVNVEPVTTNVFRDRAIPEGDLIPEEDRWDQDREEAYRVSLGEDEPYIICDKEYLENELDHEQTTLTYFAEDDVLVDEQDKPIELIDPVVGEENLMHFGKGTTSNNVVLIRNHKLSMDFEVTKREGSYTKEVLGFQHSDGPKVRKMRRDIE